MRLSLGFSPCPNDTFIFYALLHGRVDTEGLSFETFIEDVESLNTRAATGQLDVTKLSYHAFAHFVSDYLLLAAGSALGKGCGPLLIAKQLPANPDPSTWTAAIPGRLTTANFLLSSFYPSLVDKKEYVFSEIEQALLREEVDVGLIIHENRFTYAALGLQKIADLGELWETQTKLPIPLGGIVIRRTLPQAVQQAMQRVMRRSVAFAFEHPEEVMPYVRQHAQAMDEAVMKEHIRLYVNEFSLDLGDEGQAAVLHLLADTAQRGATPVWEGSIFVFQ